MYPYYAVRNELEAMRQMAAPNMGGIEDYPKFLAKLEDAINDEAGAISFYQKLIDLAPGQKQRDMIQHAHDEEIMHFKLLTGLYRRLTGREAMVRVKETVFPDYKVGLREAFKRELEAADLYQEMYLMSSNPGIRDIFFKAMTDEMEHGTRFGFLYQL